MECAVPGNPEFETLKDNVGEDHAWFLTNNSSNPDKELYDPETGELIDPKLIALYQRQIRSLINSRKELEGEVDTIKRDVLWINIEAIKASIENIKSEISYNNMINVAYGNLKEVESLLNKTDLLGKELVFMKSVLDRITTLDEAILPEKLNAEYQGKLKNLRAKSRTILESWKKHEKKLIEEMSLNEGMFSTIENLTKEIKDIGAFTTYALDLNSTNVPILRLMYSRFNTIKRKTNAVMFAYNKKFDAIKKKYTKEDFQKIMDGNRIITETKGSYFDEEREMLKDINYYLEKANGGKAKAIQFNKRDRWYKDRNDYTLTAEGEAIYKGRLAALKERLAFVNEDGKLSEKDNIYIENWETANSPYLGIAYATDPNAIQFRGNHYWYRYLNQTPKKEYINEKFNNVKDTELYKFVISTITEGMKKVPHRMLVDLNSFDKVLNGVLFDFNKEDKFTLKAAWEGVGDFYDDTFKRAITKQDIYGYSGKIVDEKGREKEKIYPKSMEDIQKEKQFENPLDLVKEFFQFATAYEHKSETEAEIWLLKGLLDEQKALRTNKAGIVLQNVEPITGGLHNAQKLAMTNILAELYGKKRLDVEDIKPTEKEEREFKSAYNKWEVAKKEAFEKGLPFTEPEPVLLKFSAVKAIDAIVDGTRYNLLWLKPLSAVVNLMIGIEGNFLHAARKVDFDDANLFHALKLLGNSTVKYASFGKIVSDEALKIKNASSIMGIEDESFGEDFKTYTSKIANFGLTWQTSGEYIIANQIMIAKMLGTKIKNLKGVETSLWDAFDKDFNFKTDEYGELDPIYIKKIKDRIREIRKQTQGDYQNALGIKSKVAGRVLMLFRTWLPRAINNRFGEQIGDEFKGRYVTYRDVYQSYTEVNGFWKGLGKMAGGQMLVVLSKIANIPGASQLGMKSLSELCDKKYEAELKKYGLTDLDIQNMRVNIRELQYIAYMIILLLTLSALGGDDPDEDLILSINTATRLYQDMTFFYSFNSATSITKDPIPIYKTIQDGYALIGNVTNYIEDPNSDIYERGRHKGGSKTEQSLYKLVPGFSAYQSTINTMSQVFGAKAH